MKHAELIDAEKRDYVRKFKESLYISKSSSCSCNLESGIYITSYLVCHCSFYKISVVTKVREMIIYIRVDDLAFAK